MFTTHELNTLAENLIIAQEMSHGKDNIAVRQIAKQLDIECHITALEQGWDENPNFSVPAFQHRLLREAKERLYSYTGELTTYWN